MTIKDKIDNIPKVPGIYLMKDKYQNVIYVGKSKQLQTRVKSYFTKTKQHSKKITRMIKNIDDIDIIITDTELDALILECEYIKNIKPMYNTLLKNHESYSYLKINNKQEYPYLEVVHEIDDDSIYFGPYGKSKQIESMKDSIVQIYRLRDCKKMTKCFKYELNQCLGPCRKHISNEEYMDNVNKLINDLRNENNEPIEKLQNQMQLEISNLNFEKASIINENINIIKNMLFKQRMINESLNDNIYLVWINLDTKRTKVYLILNGQIIRSEIMSINEFENLDKIKYINESNINLSNRNIVDKYDVDFINIIYAYINNDNNITGKIIVK